MKENVRVEANFTSIQLDCKTKSKPSFLRPGSHVYCRQCLLITQFDRIFGVFCAFYTITLFHAILWQLHQILLSLALGNMQRLTFAYHLCVFNSKIFTSTTTSHFLRMRNHSATAAFIDARIFRLSTYRTLGICEFGSFQ